MIGELLNSETNYPKCDSVHAKDVKTRNGRKVTKEGNLSQKSLEFDAAHP